MEDAEGGGVVLAAAVFILAEERCLFLMMSVFSDMGLVTPCSLRNRPQALQRGRPLGSFLHSGVVEVVQLEHLMSGLEEEEAVALEEEEGGVADDCRDVVDLIFLRAGFFFLMDEFLREPGLTIDGEGFLLSKGLLATVLATVLLMRLLLLLLLLLLLPVLF